MLSKHVTSEWMNACMKSLSKRKTQLPGESEVLVPMILPENSWLLVNLHCLLWATEERRERGKHLKISCCFFFNHSLLLKFLFFIYFRLCWVLVTACGLSLVAVLSVSDCGGFLMHPASMGCMGFSSPDSQALEHRLSGCDLVALQHVDSSRTRD